MTKSRILRATKRWSRLFEMKVAMESEFVWSPSQDHLPPKKAMLRFMGYQSKHRQLRYAEVCRKLEQAERIIDGG
jgi:hypothetical protein